MYRFSDFINTATFTLKESAGFGRYLKS